MTGPIVFCPKKKSISKQNSDLKQQLKEEKEKSKRFEEQLKAQKEASEAIAVKVQQKLKQLNELQTTMEQIQQDLVSKRDVLEKEKTEV